MNAKHWDSLDYDQILAYVISSYIKEFGERKFRAILDKVMTSNKVSGLLKMANQKGIPPGADNILFCLNEIPFFIFSKGQTLAVGALLTLQRWNEEINSHEIFLNEDELKQRAIRILNKTMIMYM